MAHAHAADSKELPAMLRSRALRPLLIAGLVVYFLYLLVAMAPARIAASAVHAAIPQVWLTSVSGSLWRGHAGGAQVDLGEKVLSLGEVSWSLNPWTLLAFNPCVAFNADSAGPIVSGTLCQSPFGSTTVKNVNIEFPVSMIEPYVHARASGQFSLQVSEARLLGRRVEALDAQFSWADAAVFNGDAWWRFGIFGGKAWANEDGSVAVHVTDISGPVGVDMTAGFVLGSEMWTAKGTVTPRTGAPEQLTQALQVVGEETAPGTYSIAWP